jgi:cell division septal protein FtsQ
MSGIAYSVRANMLIGTIRVDGYNNIHRRHDKRGYMGTNKYKERRLAKKRRQTRLAILFLTLGGLFLVGAAFLVFRGNQDTAPLAAIDVQGSPSLKVDKEQVNLGNIQLGQTVQVSFRLTNVGDQPLRFSDRPYIEVVEGC